VRSSKNIQKFVECVKRDMSSGFITGQPLGELQEDRL